MLATTVEARRTGGSLNALDLVQIGSTTWAPKAQRSSDLWPAAGGRTILSVHAARRRRTQDCGTGAPDGPVMGGARRGFPTAA